MVLTIYVSGCPTFGLGRPRTGRFPQGGEFAGTLVPAPSRGVPTKKADVLVDGSWWWVAQVPPRQRAVYSSCIRFESTDRQPRTCGRVQRRPRPVTGQ